MTILSHSIRITDFHTIVVVQSRDGEYTARLDDDEAAAHVVVAHDSGCSRIIVAGPQRSILKKMQPHVEFSNPADPDEIGVNVNSSCQPVQVSR